MKQFLTFTLIFLLSAGAAVAQECVFYYPKAIGAELEYTSYDTKDRITGMSRHRIKDLTEAGGMVTAVIEVTSFDKNKKELMTHEFSVKCEDGVYYLDMRNMMDPSTMAGMKDMEVVVESDFLEWPSRLKVGDKLKDANLTITVFNAGMRLMSMVTTVTNREVVGSETISTPAGSFNCHKLTSDIQTKSIVSVKLKSADWFSEEVGSVRNESYSSSGKINGYTLLTAVRK